MLTEMMLSGLFFLLIIITNLASNRFGYQTFGDLDKEAKLEKIGKYPRRFKISFVLILIEHFIIILLAITLFFAFNTYNLILAVIWTISRSIEGLIQIINKKSYWGLLNIAKKYLAAIDADKKSLDHLRFNILKSKMSNFLFAQIFFTVGTLAYSTLFVVYEVIPVFIGWFGIIAGIIYGLGNGIFSIKPKFKALWNLGGLLILIFEIILGGSLIYYSMI
ncbi:MAG: DUF4386 domain-containing protein [Thermoplasmatales archaeon]|nr:MAG: DUF4386 domain-containing protein [Thermoplasmatales archaeon]